MKPENKDQQSNTLTCNVVGAEAFGEDIMKLVDDDKGAHPVKTVGGCTWTAKYEGDKLMVEDENGNLPTSPSPTSTSPTASSM